MATNLDPVNLIILILSGARVNPRICPLNFIAFNKSIKRQFLRLRFLIPEFEIEIATTSFSMQRRAKKRKTTKPDVVYDDDTSDSSDSENLISFQKSVLAQKKSNNTDTKIDSSSDADDEVENESSEQNEETSDESSSTTTDDEEEEESSNLLQNKTKIESLRSQLSTLSKVNKNENICDKKDFSDIIQNTTLEKTDKESDKKNEEILVVEDLNGKPGPVVQNDEVSNIC